MRVRRRAPEERSTGDAHSPEPEPLLDVDARRWAERQPRRALALLVVLIAAVSGVGIVAGRALTPVQRSTATVVTTTTTTSTRAKPPPRPRRTAPKPAVRWGPLAVRIVATFTPGAGGGTAAAAAGRLVVVGGRGDDQIFSGPPSGRLARTATLGSSRAAAVAFAAGASVDLVGGERGSTPTAAVVRIDAGSGHAFADGSFEEPIAESGLAVAGAHVYLVGGWTGQLYASAILKLSPGGAASLLARLPAGVRFPAVALVGGRLIVAGGRTQNGLSRELLAIDIATGTVAKLGQLPVPVEQALLVRSGSKLYLLGGRSSSGAAVATVIEIDPSTGITRAAGRMPRPLADAVALALGGRTLVVASGLGLVYRLG